MSVALHRYEALSSAGELMRGEREAPEAEAVVRWLQDSGHLPLHVEPPDGSRILTAGARRPRLRRAELGLFARELASLLHAGLAVDRALQVIAEVSAPGPARELAASLQRSVRAGLPMSEALQAEAPLFGAFHIGVVRAAEAAGRLDEGFARMADYEARARALRDSIASALAYPCILVGVAGVSLVVILAYVVPQFAPLFADAGRALPLPTRLVMAAAEAFQAAWWLLPLAALAAAVLVRAALASPAGRYRWDSAVLRLPLAGELVRRAEMARFARALGTLLEGGVSLDRSLVIARDIVSNRVMAGSLELAAEGLKAGRGLAEPLAATGHFPALGLQLVRVGEETGRLGEMLEHVAALYEAETAAATRRMLVVLEPVLVIGLGLVIAGIVMSVLVAIVGVNDLPL